MGAPYHAGSALRDFGPGFHPDTPPAEYVGPEGRAILSGAECAELGRSLDRLFEALGDAAPYEIGAVEAHVMLAMAAWGQPAA